MLEQEPHRANYADLKSVHEAAPSPQPGNQPSQRNYSELKTDHATIERQQEVKRTPELQQANVIDDAGCKMEAYRKELQLKFERGEIDKHEQIRREKLYDQQLASAINSAPIGEPVLLPEPQPARTDRQLRYQPSEAQQKPDQLLVKPMDWERMLTDPAYRKEMEQQSREQRALRLRQMEQEQGTGQQRTGSGGRER